MPQEKTVQDYIDMGLEAYLSERLLGQINWMEGKSAFNKKRYQQGKLIEIIFSVSIPLLVTMVDIHPYFKYFVGLVGVAIAAVEGVLSLYDYQTNWVNYRQTLENLNREKYLFATKSGVYKKDKSFQFFVERVESILGSESQNWAEFASKEVEVSKE